MKIVANIFIKLLSSFDNDSKGFSARKLSAFVGVLMSVYATVHYVDGTTVIDAMKVWLVFACICLGIITIEQFMKFKNGGNSEPTRSEPKPTENENLPK